MRLPGFFGSRRGIVIAGAAIGVMAALLQYWGNPPNMGLCMVCFVRDIAGAIGLHRAPVVQYLRPEIPGFFPREGWPKTTGDKIRSSPAVGDLDGDGKLEIVIGDYEGKVYAWKEDGSSFSGDPGCVLYETLEGIRSTAALVDLNGNDLPEVIIGSDDNVIHIVDPTAIGPVEPRDLRKTKVSSWRTRE